MMKNYFEYKGYIGTVEMSIEDGTFFGTVHGLDDLITFEAENFSDLKKAFEEAIDDYLIFCEECGKEPEKLYKGQFNVRFSPKMHRDLAMEAAKQQKSLNQIMENACSNYLHERMNKHIVLESYAKSNYSTYSKKEKNVYGRILDKMPVRFRNIYNGGIQ